MEACFALPNEKLRPSSAGVGNSHSDMAHRTWSSTTQARMGFEDQSSKTLAYCLTQIVVYERGLSDRLKVVQCEQTTTLATLRIRCREEVEQSLQGRVRFVLRMRLQHGNHLDCFIGALSARGRWLGIFAVATLTRLCPKHMRDMCGPVCGMLEERSAPKSKPHSQITVRRRDAS